MASISRNGRAAVLIAAVAMAVLAGRANAAEGGVTFRKDFNATLADAAEQSKVVVAYFHGPWCKWCGKMSVSTFPDRRVGKLADDFLWVKVDIEQKAAIAARFGIRGVPTMILLNARGEPLQRVTGYRTAEQLAKLLRANADKAAARGEAPEVRAVAAALKKLGRGDPQADAATVAKAVELLARPDGLGRSDLLEAIDAAGKPAWSGLVKCLGDDRLAVRAAGYDALVIATGGDLPYDPFDAEGREARIAAWRKWIDTHEGKVSPACGPTTCAATRPAGDACDPAPSEHDPAEGEGR
jgi:thioredoxin-related protein